ncbi:MAG: aminoacyl-tRNA hydrolase [Pseudomonadota bacterium]
MTEPTEAIQYIVVRQDLSMSRGKLAGQVAHASLGAVIPHHRGANPYIQHFERFPDFSEDVEAWFAGPFVKVVCGVPDRAALLALAAKLDGRAIPYVVIRDICRTELDPEDADGRTPTCLGVVPLLRGKVPGVLRHLPLLRD